MKIECAHAFVNCINISTHGALFFNIYTSKQRWVQKKMSHRKRDQIVWHACSVRILTVGREKDSNKHTDSAHTVNIRDRLREKCLFGRKKKTKRGGITICCTSVFALHRYFIKEQVSLCVFVCPCFTIFPYVFVHLCISHICCSCVHFLTLCLFVPVQWRNVVTTGPGAGYYDWP